jgi:hypothetical protein
MPIALSSLPTCGDFDIEKMRPEWRDEIPGDRIAELLSVFSIPRGQAPPL